MPQFEPINMTTERGVQVQCWTGKMLSIHAGHGTDVAFHFSAADFRTVAKVCTEAAEWADHHEAIEAEKRERELASHRLMEQMAEAAAAVATPISLTRMLGPNVSGELLLAADPFADTHTYALTEGSHPAGFEPLREAAHAE